MENIECPSCCEFFSSRSNLLVSNLSMSRFCWFFIETSAICAWTAAWRKLSEESPSFHWTIFLPRMQKRILYWKYLQVSANVMMLKYSLLFRFIKLNTKNDWFAHSARKISRLRKLWMSVHILCSICLFHFPRHISDFFTNLRHISKMKTQLSSGRGLPVLYAKRISWLKAVWLSVYSLRLLLPVFKFLRDIGVLNTGKCSCLFVLLAKNISWTNAIWLWEIFLVFTSNIASQQHQHAEHDQVAEPVAAGAQPPAVGAELAVGA